MVVPPGSGSRHLAAHVHSGWLLSALLLLPNLLWILWPGPALATTLPRWTSALQPIETTLRIGVFALPFFLPVNRRRPAERVALIVAAAALVFYYLMWLRYLGSGRITALLYAPWHGIPVPLAGAPVAYLLASAVLTRSWLLATVTAVFGIVHVSMSLATAGALRSAGAF